MITEKMGWRSSIAIFVSEKLFSERFLRILLIVGVCLLSLVVPQLLRMRFLVLFLAALVGLGAVVFMIQKPMIGLVSIVVSALIIPTPPLPGNINLAVMHLTLLLVLWFADKVVHKKEFKFVESTPLKFLVGMVVVAIVSFFIGQLTWFQFADPAPLDAQLGGLMIFVLTVGAFFMVAQDVRDVIWLKIMVWLYVGITMFHVLGWFISPISNISNILFTNGTINSSMFWLWLGTLAFGQTLFNYDLKIKWRLVFAFSAALTFYIAFVLNTGWKSGYLPLVASVGTLLALRMGPGAIIVGLIGAAPALYIGQAAIASDQYSYFTRLDAWAIMLEIIQRNPLFGFGPANYYWYTPLFPIRGYSVVFNSHNQYLDIVAQIGLLGLLFFILFAISLALLGWRLRHRVKDGFSKAYVYSILAGLVGLLLSGMLVDWFIPFVYNIGFAGFRTSMLAWMFMGGLVAIDQIEKEKERKLSQMDPD